MQEVIKFLQQLITSMGQHTEFNVGHICEGDDFTTAVNWHLGMAIRACRISQVTSMNFSHQLSMKHCNLT